MFTARSLIKHHRCRVDVGTYSSLDLGDDVAKLGPGQDFAKKPASSRDLKKPVARVTSPTALTSFA